MANTKTILVTGAGSGIGRAIAQRLSKNNYPLILLGRNLNKLEEARNSLESPEKHQCYFKTSPKKHFAATSIGPVKVKIASENLRINTIKWL